MKAIPTTLPCVSAPESAAGAAVASAKSETIVAATGAKPPNRRRCSSVFMFYPPDARSDRRAGSHPRACVSINFCSDVRRGGEMGFEIQRRAFLGAAAAAGAGLASGGVQAAAPPPRGKTILVAHGAWSAGWVWKKMHPLMTAAGHLLITPTQTGLGEREHLATRDVDLETHIQDLLGVIKHEELNDFVLLGHSYGGMVATGVADRVPERISQLIYLDAFVPRDGQSLLDLQGGADAARAMR